MNMLVLLLYSYRFTIYSLNNNKSENRKKSQNICQQLLDQPLLIGTPTFCCCNSRFGHTIQQNQKVSFNYFNLLFAHFSLLILFFYPIGWEPASNSRSKKSFKVKTPQRLTSGILLSSLHTIFLIVVWLEMTYFRISRLIILW